MKSATQPASDVSINHYETDTPASELLLPCRCPTKIVETAPKNFLAKKSQERIDLEIFLFKIQGKRFFLCQNRFFLATTSHETAPNPASGLLKHTARNWPKIQTEFLSRSFYLPGCYCDSGCNSSRWSPLPQSLRCSSISRSLASILGLFPCRLRGRTEAG
jgi:hypothetical protein